MEKLRSTKYPLGHILNPRTQYTSAAQTNIAETFKRIREEQEQALKTHSVIKLRQK